MEVILHALFMHAKPIKVVYKQQSHNKAILPCFCTFKCKKKKYICWNIFNYSMSSSELPSNTTGNQAEVHGEVPTASEEGLRFLESISK